MANASYRSVGNLLSSCLLCKHMMNKIYKSIILKNAVFWDVIPCGSSYKSQKMAFFIVTKMKTSNPISIILFVPCTGVNLGVSH
jgi:hypothetical protein